VNKKNKRQIQIVRQYSNKATNFICKTLWSFRFTKYVCLSVCLYM